MLSLPEAGKNWKPILSIASQRPGSVLLTWENGISRAPLTSVTAAWCWVRARVSWCSKALSQPLRVVLAFMANCADTTVVLTGQYNTDGIPPAKESQGR